MDLQSTIRRPIVFLPALGLLALWLVAWCVVRVGQALVEQKVERRFGAPVEIGDVDLGLSRQALADVHIGGPGFGMDVKVKRIEADASLSGLLFSGRSALRGIAVHGVVGSLDLTKLAPPVVPDGLHSRKTRRTGGVSRPRPALRVANVDLKIRDAHGLWLEAGCASARLTAAGGRLDQGHVRLAENAGELRVSGVSLEASTGAGTANARPQLDSGLIEQVALRLDRHKGAPLSWGRTRSALSTLKSVFLPERIVDGEPAPTHLPLQVKGVQGAAPSQSDGVDGLPGGAGQAAPMGGGERATAAAAALSPLLRVLAADAEIEVQDTRVELAREGRVESLLSGARIALTAEGEGRLATEGRGQAIGGGGIAWNLTVGVEPLQVEGDLEVKSLPLSLLAGAVPQVPWYEPDRGRMDARLKLRTKSVGLITWDGELAFDGVGLFSTRIAPEPVVDIRVALEGHGALRPLVRRLEVAGGRLRIGDAQLEVSGAAALKGDTYHLALDANLPRTSCETAVQAIPAGLLGDLTELGMEGQIAGNLHLLLDSEELEATELEIEVNDRCEFVSVPESVNLRRFRAPFLHEVVEEDGSQFSFVTGPGTDEFTYLEDISPFLVHAVLAHEDTRFFTHGGFSPFHIRNALVRNLQEGRYVVGASTISMQLVKNILLHREKTLARKLQEVLLTWYLERVMDKQEILELYLNVIEYGPDIYGIRHAAYHYFKRTPAQLSPAEAAFFATILPSPKRRHAYYERGALTPAWQARVRSLVQRLGARESYDELAVTYALQELEDFQFVKDGQVAEPRLVEGTTEPLPYQAGFWAAEDLGLTNTNPVGQGMGFSIP